MDTQQNTEFSLAVKADVKAPGSEIVVSRCEVGAALMRQWAKDMREVTMLTLDAVWGRGYLKYAAHARECIFCTNFDFRLRGIK